MRSLSRMRRLAASTVRAVGRRPIVSLVIPAYNVAAYIDQTLTSVLGQGIRDLEVIVVDDGSDDDTVEVVERISASDRRVRLIQGEHGGPGVARNLGMDAARGRYLGFVDADDLLPAGALKTLLRSVDATGSQIALGALRRFNSKRTWIAEWIGEVHATPRARVTLDDCPSLLRNFYPVGKLYRRDFWMAQGLRFGDESLFEDQPLITQLLNRATSIDVLTDIVYDYRAREDRSSNSQRPEELRNLLARVAAWDRSVAALRQEASPAVQRAWLLTVYATHLHWYLNNDAVADPEYWAILRGAMRRLAAQAPADLLEATPVARRVAVALLLADRREDLIAFREAGGYDRGGLPATPTTAGLEHVVPLSGAALEVITAECSLRTRPEEVELRQQASGGGWVEVDEQLCFRVQGYAYVPDLARTRPDAIALVLTDDHGTSARVDATLLDDVAVDDPVDAGQGYLADVPTTIFEAVQSGQWAVDLEVSYGPVRVRTPMRNAAVRAGLPESGTGALSDGRQVRLVTSPNRHVGAVFTVVRPDLAATAVNLHADGTLRVEGALGDGIPRPTRVSATLGATTATGHVTGAGRRFVAELRLPERPAATTSDWRVRLSGNDAGTVPVAWAAGRREGLTRSGDLIAMATVKGDLKVEDHRATGVCTVSSVEVAARTVRLSCAVSQEGGAPATAVLELTLDALPEADDELPVRRSITYDGRALCLVPAESDGESVPVLAEPAVLARLPLRVPQTPLVLERGRGRSLALRMPAQR